MPIQLPQGPISARTLICRRLVFVGDNSEMISANALTPTRIVLPQVNEPLTPTLAFGDGDSGFFERIDDEIDISLATITRFRFSGNSLRAELSDGPNIINRAATDTNPVFSFVGDSDTGVGRRTDDIGVLIAGAQNCMEFGEAAGAPLVAFYGTAAIALQTGVAVTAAGIHAALVALGLITA